MMQCAKWQPFVFSTYESNRFMYVSNGFESDSISLKAFVELNFV